MKVIIYNNFDIKIENIWNRLYLNSHNTIFQKFEWNNIWYNNIGIHHDNSKLLIAVVYSSNEPIALFPLYIHKFKKIKFIKYIWFCRNYFI